MIWPYLGFSTFPFSNLGINPKESPMSALASDIPSKRAFSILASSVALGLVATSIVVLGGASPANSAPVACSTTVTEFEGDGSRDDPFRIDNAADLIFLSTMSDDEYNYGAYFVQTANIDLGNCEFKPIGYIYDEQEEEELAFFGKYNGQGFTVSGLRITQPPASTSKSIGLFGYVDEFDLSNLTVQGSISLPADVNVRFVGGVIGEAGETNISNVKSEVTIDSASGTAIGGIAGYINYGSIDRSVYKGALSTVSADGVGGLVGLADLVTVTSSYSISTFNTGVVGAGLFGQETCDPDYDPEVSNAYVVGSGATYGIQKLNCGEFDSTFWNSSLSPNTATFADPLFGAVAKTTAQLKAFATYPASWNIVDGWDLFSASAPLKTWGICSGVNDGYPFLLWEYSTDPCLSAASAPSITSIAPASSSGTLSVAFTAPTSDGGAVISNYKYSIDNGATWVTRSPIATTSPLVIQGLTDGTSYQIKLLAINSEGDGEPSSSVTGTPVTTASAPTITAITASSESLSVAFTAPSSDGGAAISNYKYSLDNGATWITRSAASISSPLVITGLTNGTSYQVKLLAINSVDDGASSAAVTATPVTPPENDPSPAPIVPPTTQPTTQPTAQPTTQPTTAPTASPSAGIATTAGSLAVTGTSAPDLIGLSIGLLIFGSGFLLLGRSRRREYGRSDS
jgi:hypothetical protein